MANRSRLFALATNFNEYYSGRLAVVNGGDHMAPILFRLTKLSRTELTSDELFPLIGGSDFASSFLFWREYRHHRSLKGDMEQLLH